MATALDARIEAVRLFNRFYTRKIGVLQAGLLDSRFSLTQVRVLYELAHRENPTATELGRELGLDAGYLSRMLRDFIRQGLVTRKASPADTRQHLLKLTPRGRQVFARLNARSQQEVRGLLRDVLPTDQSRLLAAMHTIQGLLEEPGNLIGTANSLPFTLRSYRPGDLGWVVHRHGALYAQEYGYDERFEALVAQVIAQFVQNFDPKRERCWIAERDGQIVGSVFLVKKSPKVAKLRLLFVEPAARGLGLGRRLISECVNFGRKAGYKKMTLWTQSELHAARHLYKQAGFRLAGKRQHKDFGKPSVAEIWDLKL
jgi:DNA-binding MarR family transcriptional regulator/GNAT superfamily N-acetyltransferase